MIKIYNSLSRKKEVIKPLKGKKINLFVCGPTVYDYSHIGHARTYIIFDCFVKYLKHLGFKVFYLQNITDIDDKIILRAKEKGVSPKILAEVFTKEHLKDMTKMGITSVSKYAKATNYIKEIISQIQRLLDKGYAYQLNDGVYYDISKFKDYGKLSGRTALEAEDSISRIDYSKNKKNRGDFCLWKLNQHSEEPSWPSPFGKGRPGWHIEDTAITEKFFGSQYDIHGGARDLLFPHHEAEVAQMEAISGKKPLAKYWMHTGFLTFESQKMGKSLNNFITINDFLKMNSYRHLRFLIAKNLWGSPINYSESAIIEARSGLERIEEFLRKIKNQKLKIKNIPISSRTLDADSIEHSRQSRNKVGAHQKLKIIIKKTKGDFYKNLNDNFNTPKAFAVIFDMINEMNKILDLPAQAGKNVISKKSANDIYRFFEEINKIFSIIDFKKLKQIAIPKKIKGLLKERENYRKSNDWKKADELRMQIESYGYLTEDTKEGTILKRA